MSSRIRMQADDFFKAYQVLTGNYDTATLAIMGPSVVCLAFSVELYIKDLHFALKGEAPWGHNILDLFRGLPEGAQQEIRNHPAMQKITAYYSMQLFPLYYIPQDKSKQPITDILEQQIYKISDAFEKWRYAHENGTLNYEETTALAFIEAIKSAADTVTNKKVRQ